MTCIVCCRKLRRAVFGKGRDSINAFAARWTWYSVISGFFSPQPVRLPRQKQVAHLSEKQMPTQRLIVADLEMAQTQFAFFVLQATFDRPAGEPHVQQNLQRNARRRIGQKVLLVRRIQHVAGVDQPPWAMHFPLALCQRGIIRTSQTIGPFPVSLMWKRTHG